MGGGAGKLRIASHRRSEALSMYQPSNDLSLQQREQLDKPAEQFKSDFVAGKRRAIEDCLDKAPELRPDLLAMLIM